MLTCDSYLMPATLAELFEAMAAHDGRHRLVAGATDLLPWAREGRAGDVHTPVLIDVSGVPDLQGWSIEGDRVRLGAALPFQRFLDDPRLARELPVMPRCAVWFADDQIRESATIGGNIVNASPAADGTPPLLALDASVRIGARRGGAIEMREMPLAAFVTGPGRTALGAGEVVLSIACARARGYGGAFEKVGHRRSLVISTVCVAALVKPSADGRTFEDVRLAAGGIGPVPLRLSEVEAFLTGGEVSDARIAAAAERPLDFVQSRTRRDYRRDVLAAFLRNAVHSALAELGGRARAA